MTQPYCPVTHQRCADPRQACHMTGVILCAGLVLPATSTAGETITAPTNNPVPMVATHVEGVEPCAMTFPHVTLTSKQLSALVYLPDEKHGYNRGTRFDWSGIVAQVGHKGHTYLGPLHHEFKPGLHDNVAGLAEEFSMFDPLGYDEVPQGGSFIKIGIGELHRPGSDKYQFHKKYRITRAGEWKVQVTAQSIRFEQRFEGLRGWGYAYVKTITLSDDAPVLTIERELRNIGEKPIRTTHYNHNFYTFDGRKTVGPNYRMEFGWPLRAVEWRDNGPMRIDGSTLHIDRELNKGESLWAVLEGYGASAQDNRVRVFDPQTQMGVEMTGDQPLTRAVVWGFDRVVCPELFVKVEVEPGQTMRWSHRYTFKPAR